MACSASPLVAEWYGADLWCWLPKTSNNHSIGISSSQAKSAKSIHL